jgi:hypothetical protein
MIITIAPIIPTLVLIAKCSFVRKSHNSSIFELLFIESRERFSFVEVQRGKELLKMLLGRIESSEVCKGRCKMYETYRQSMKRGRNTLQYNAINPNISPYFCHHLRNDMDRETAGRWIGRGGPIA